jgi:hypothetical protein
MQQFGSLRGELSESSVKEVLARVRIPQSARLQAVLASLPITTQNQDNEVQENTATALLEQVRRLRVTFTTSVEEDQAMLQGGSALCEGDARMGDILRYRIERQMLISTAQSVLEAFLDYVKQR